MNARALGLLVAVAAMSSFAGTLHPVSSTFDAETQTWIGNVTELTNALWAAEEGDEIVLAKGNYDLKDLAVNGVLMRETSSTSYSPAGAILDIRQNKMTLRGETGDPRDVVISVSENPGYRILGTTKSSVSIRDLTMTGGKSTASNCGAWNYRGGGAIGMQGSPIVSNCVFYGNSSPRHGGAVSGLNGRSGKVIDCVFYGNNGTLVDGDGGLAGGYSTFVNCVFTNNVTSAAANSYGVGVVCLSVLTNCLVADNVFPNGALYNCVATDCRVLRNYAKSTNYNNSWGGGAKNSTCTNCTFIGNSTYRGGGAGYGGNFVDCTVISNAVRYENYEGFGGGIYNANNVIGCTIVSNTANYGTGGGVCSCAFVSNCVIRYNAARIGMDSGREGGYPNKGGGGGAAHSNCYDCEFVGNAVNFGPASGAMLNGSAYNCTFRDHSSPSFHSVSNIVGCDVEKSGGFINPGMIVNCTVHDCDNRPSVVRALHNVVFQEGITNKQHMYMIEKARLVRNCLFVNNIQAMLSGSSVNTAMFNGDGASATGRVENCTIADCVNYHLTRNYKGSYPLEFVNCALVRNRTGVTATTYNDTASLDLTAGNLTFASCAFTKMSSGTADDKCVTVTSPKFVGSGEHPYTPKTSSPLVKNKGVRLDWMDDALDLAGNPRLKDGQVDIGAYQCWLTAPGMMLIFR